MELIIYPYKRVMTEEALAKRNLPASLMRDFADGVPCYKAYFPPNNVYMSPERSKGIEGLIELAVPHSKVALESGQYQRPINIVHHSAAFKKQVESNPWEIGEVRELDDQEFEKFAKSFVNL